MKDNQDINHYCIVCGTGYHACDSCSEVKQFKPWRVLTDTIEHFKIYMTLNSYNNKKISKQEAQEELKSLNLVGWESFKESSKKVIRELLESENTNAPEINNTKSNISAKTKSKKNTSALKK